MDLSYRQGGDSTLCPTCIPHAGKEEMTPSVLLVALMQTRRRWHPLSYLYPSCWEGGDDTLCIPHAGTLRQPGLIWHWTPLCINLHISCKGVLVFLTTSFNGFLIHMLCILMAFKYSDSCCETLNFFYFYLCIGNQVFPRLLIHWVLFLKILAKNLNPTSTIKSQWRPWQVYMALNCIKLNNLQTFSFICWLYLVNNWV